MPAPEPMPERRFPRPIEISRNAEWGDGTFTQLTGMQEDGHPLLAPGTDVRITIIVEVTD